MLCIEIECKGTFFLQPKKLIIKCFGKLIRKKDKNLHYCDTFIKQMMLIIINLIQLLLKMKNNEKN